MVYQKVVSRCRQIFKQKIGGEGDSHAERRNINQIVSLYNILFTFKAFQSLPIVLAGRSRSFNKISQKIISSSLKLYLILQLCNPYITPATLVNLLTLSDPPPLCSLRHPSLEVQHDWHLASSFSSFRSRLECHLLRGFLYSGSLHWPVPSYTTISCF